MKDSTDQELVAAKLAVNDDEKICENYEPLRILGQGGMGQVILAKHRLLGHFVAIKRIITGDSGPDSRICSRFLNEAKAAQRLKHQNVVQMHEFGVDARGCPYAVMDYIEGETLASVLQQERLLTAARTASLCGQVAEGLAHAHERGVVHRDIKPSNIIVQKIGEQERAVIVDFGLAKLISGSEQELTKTGEIFGSPLYFSPEQALGQAVGPRSDIYSLGCVMFECNYGHPPFVGDTPIQTAMMHVNSEIPIPPSPLVATDPITKVIKRCMQKSFRERYSTAAELAACLKTISENIPVKGLSSHGNNRHRSVIPAVATMLLLIAFAGMLYLRLTRAVEGTPAAPEGSIDPNLFPDIPATRYISRSAKEAVTRDMKDAMSLSTHGQHSKAGYALRATGALLEEEKDVLEKQSLNLDRTSQKFKDLHDAIWCVSYNTAKCYALAADRFREGQEYELASKYYKKSIPWFTKNARYLKNIPFLDSYYQNYIDVLNRLKDPEAAAEAESNYRTFLLYRDKKPSK